MCVYRVTVEVLVNVLMKNAPYPLRNTMSTRKPRKTKRKLVFFFFLRNESGNLQSLKFRNAYR